MAKWREIYQRNWNDYEEILLICAISLFWYEEERLYTRQAGEAHCTTCSDWGSILMSEKEWKWWESHSLILWPVPIQNRLREMPFLGECFVSKWPGEVFCPEGLSSLCSEGYQPGRGWEASCGLISDEDWQSWPIYNIFLWNDSAEMQSMSAKYQYLALRKKAIEIHRSYVSQYDCESGWLSERAIYSEKITKQW